ncbi:MAG: AAA family ATPase [Chitinophagaceae bacterium]|nr:AAA family ATPase [Anaerolineae bacterium]
MNDPHIFTPSEPLTERELDILGLIAEGLSNSEIAEKLVLSVETVRWYAKQIYSKLGVHSRTQASIRARDLGVLSGESTPSQWQPEPAIVHHLPTFTTPFISRDAEIAELAALLEDPHVQLITVVGPGGIGKSRLCVEVARTQSAHFTDGVYYLPLLSVHSASEAEIALAHEIGLRLNPEKESRSQLLHFLQHRRLLLVMDNFESVLEEEAQGTDLITDLLAHVPQMKLLIASHVSLNLRDEWVRQIEGMSFPNSLDVDQPESYGAVQLFYDRVQRVRRDFSLADNLSCVIEICQMVQGVPLAIELAAAWLKTLACKDVAKEIQRNIDFLATTQRDIEARHRSIRAVFEYAWNLLTEQEQHVFRRLSVFQGGFGRAAAEQVAGASLATLSELVSKSLLQQNTSGLYEIHSLLRKHAEQKLESLDHTMRSKRTNMLVGWLTLIKGDFAKIREIATEVMDSSLDTNNEIDKAFALAALGILAGIDEDYEGCRQLCEASQARLKSDTISVIFSSIGLAIASCGLEDYASAKRHILAALKLVATLRIPAFILLCLPVISVVLAYEAEVERAVELTGLAFTHPTSTLGWMEKWPLLQRLNEDLRAELGVEDYTAAWERGKTLNPEAVAASLWTEATTR